VVGFPAEMQRALGSVDSALTFSGFYSMADLMGGALALQRVEVALLTVMAGLALLLSAVGIFALIANIVAQRTREIGIRMALGATPRKTLRHVASSGLWACAIGGITGLLVALGALRAMRGVIYGVGVYNAPTLSLVVLCLGVVTVAATIVPALRIGRIDPATILREE
jgi:putative ABC transport system permease protein